MFSLVISDIVDALYKKKTKNEYIHNNKKIHITFIMIWNNDADDTCENVTTTMIKNNGIFHILFIIYLYFILWYGHLLWIFFNEFANWGKSIEHNMLQFVWRLHSTIWFYDDFLSFFARRLYTQNVCISVRRYVFPIIIIIMSNWHVQCALCRPTAIVVFFSSTVFCYSRITFRIISIRMHLINRQFDLIRVLNQMEIDKMDL